MVAEVFAGVGALKSAFDLAKGLKEIDDASRRNAAVIDLQEKILTAQSAQSSMLDRISELEKKVESFERWEREKERYALRDVSGRGEFAYVLKASMQAGEPSHAICVNCYQESKKAVLQFSGKGFEAEKYWRCPVCENVTTTFGPITAV